MIRHSDFVILTSSFPISIFGGTRTASDSDGNDSITLDHEKGTITTKTLSTGPGLDYTFTLVNSLLLSGYSTLGLAVNGQTGAGKNTRPVIIHKYLVSNGSAAITLRNIDSTNKLNGTVTIDFEITN